MGVGLSWRMMRGMGEGSSREYIMGGLAFESTITGLTGAFSG
jgi:hypothetical protein